MMPKQRATLPLHADGLRSHPWAGQEPPPKSEPGNEVVQQKNKEVNKTMEKQTFK